MLIKPINTVVLAEDFEKVKEWYIDTFDFVEVSYPGMEDAYVDLLSGDQVIVGITQNDTKEPLPIPRKMLSTYKFLVVTYSPFLRKFLRMGER